MPPSYLGGSMKLSSGLKKVFKTTNEHGVSVEAVIRPDDAVQMNVISKAYAVFFKLEDKNVELNKEDVDSILAAFEEIADDMKEINKYLDMAFGDDYTKQLFQGSYSLLMYAEYFDGLGEILGDVEKMSKDYVAKKRLEGKLQDFKDKDTL